MNNPADFVFSRSYRGKVQGVILDWSGTTADAYVIAPAVVFVEVFKNQGVEISMLEARGPMGLRKDLHIKMLTQDPVIKERWKSIKGQYPTDIDVANMFEEFVPAQVACLPLYTSLLPGIATVTQQLQKDGIKLGVSTGFTRPMVDVLLKAAIEQGFSPDTTVAGDEVLNGARPKPHMVYKNMDLLDITTIQSVVKVDDTTSGVGEGLNAGCWTVGVARYSNYMNINSLEEAAALTQSDITRLTLETRQLLREAGAHYVIDTIVDLPAVIEDINARLSRGERP
ncbi:MAG: phosphonoacetaldehyde hydrolase [Oceanospirillaceae bacterium]|nr:phosphonoacetaldehyde hydrolase [Oceanospirillaceae bacterium]